MGTGLDEASRLRQPEAGAPRSPDPRDAARDLPSDAPQGAVDVARGHKADGKSERSVVAFLLGQQRAPRYGVRVEFATDEGDMPLWFLISSLDSKRIDDIEKAHTDRNSVMGEVDDLTINAEIVADATVAIGSVDPKSSEWADCEKTIPTSEDFLHGNASAAEALKQRFHWQGGLLTGVATQVRRISGWAPDRVGQAERVLVDVAGGS